MTKQYTPAQLEAWAGLGPWKSQGQEPDGVYIIGLRTDKDGVPYDNPTNGLVGAALPFPTELDSGDFTRVLTNAALIAAAPDLARLVLEKEKEIAELKAAALDIVSLCSADVKMNGTTYQPMPYRSAFTKAVERLIELINTDRQAMKGSEQS